MSPNAKRSRGRPPTTPIERLRVSIWSMDAQARSNLETAEAFEQVLNANGIEPIITKGQWSRHMRGDVSPQGSKSNAQSSLLLHVERLYPGTMETFNHPVWRLLDFEVLFGPRELQQIYFSMDESIWQSFHFSQEFCNEGSRPEDLFFWRKPPTDHDELRDILDSIQGLNGVAVGLIEARMAYLAQKPTMCIFYMTQITLALRNCHRTMPFLADVKGQTILLTLEGMCILEAVKLFSHLPQQPIENQRILSDKKMPTSAQEYVFDLYDSWEKRCLKHITKLSPKALDTFQIWNNEIARYQGLINWQILNVPG